MSVVADDVRTLLRPTEHVDVALEAEYLQDTKPTGVDQHVQQRILAVVLHSGGFGGPEEGRFAHVSFDHALQTLPRISTS